LYFHSDTHTINGQLGNVANETQSNTIASASMSLLESGTPLTGSCGWRVWISHYDNSSTELTSGTPVATVTRTANGTGLQSGTWKPDLTSLGWVDICSFNLKIIFYMKLDGTWTAKASFVTSALPYRKIKNETWTLYCYTNFTQVYYELLDNYNAYLTVYWGTPTYDTRITNMKFEDARTWERSYRELRDGNFIGFLTTPYTALIGPLFYCGIMLIVCVPIYVRTQSVTPILILFILFGGAGGMFDLLVPALGFDFAWIILMLGLAGLLYKTVKGVSEH
jgi:hypothetical protein